MSIESGPCTFYYLIAGNACFLTLTEKGYPKKLAFQYLEELAREFSQLYGSQVDGVTRPYAFIKFGELGGGFHQASAASVSAAVHGYWGVFNNMVTGGQQLTNTAALPWCLLPCCKAD